MSSVLITRRNEEIAAMMATDDEPMIDVGSAGMPWTKDTEERERQEQDAGMPYRTNAANHLDRQCAVCDAPTSGWHFGAFACAACSAFFRRSVAERRTYDCRRTGAKHLRCSISYAARCFCRACRLQKCLAIGMDPKSVQPHRDPIGLKGKRKSGDVCAFPDSGDDDEVVKSKVPSLPPSADEVGCAPPKTPETVVDRFQPLPLIQTSLSVPQQQAPSSHQDSSVSNSCTDDTDSPSSGANNDGCWSSPSDRCPNLVESVVQQYNGLRERRRLLYCPNTLRDMLGGEQAPSRPAIPFEGMRTPRVDVALRTDFLSSIYIFRQLSVDDKITLFRWSSITISILEKHYHTYRNSGFERGRMIYPNGSYIDLTVESHTIAQALKEYREKDKDFLPSFDAEAVERMFLIPLRDSVARLCGAMRDCDMTDTEFCALTAIMLYDPNCLGLSEAARPVVRSARERLQRDWFALYAARGMDQDDAVQRVGCTLLLLSTLQTIATRVRENFYMLRVFGLIEYDSLLDDVFS